MIKKLRIVVLIALSLFLLVGCFGAKDKIAPEITGLDVIYYFIGDEQPDFAFGVEAIDDVDGDLTEQITIDSSGVNFTVDGTYTIVYTVTDEAGNKTELERSIVVSSLTLEQKADRDIEWLDLSTGELLPEEGPNGSTFRWTSSNTQVITPRGYVIRPPMGSDPVNVTLSAVVRNGTFTKNVEYVVTVQPKEPSVVTDKRTLAFVGTSTEYVVENNPAVDVYYVDNGEVPFMDIETFLTLVNGAIQSDELTFTMINANQMEISYSYEYEDLDGTWVVEEYVAVIDFAANTIMVNNYDFFSNYVASTETDYGEGLNYVDVFEVEGSSITIPLGNYRFDLIVHEEGEKTVYLMPLHVANLLFCGNIYYDVFYNGDKLVGVDTFSINNKTFSPLYQARSSSYNHKVAPTDIKEATYHFLALALDYFYGLKSERGVTSYYTVLAPYADDIITRGDTTMYRKLFDLSIALDDLHTSHAFPGYYEDVNYSLGISSYDDFATRVRTFYNGYFSIQDALRAKFGSLTLPSRRLLDNEKTAVIYLTGFTVDTPGRVKNILDNLPETVENVVIDLTYNTGGNLGAVLRIFGYMTDGTYEYHSQNPTDGSAVTYVIESDYEPYEYNWFIVTSSVTFSAANLMASIAKEQGIATVIGQKSSGGASSIGAIVTPVGTTFLVSTNNVLSARIGNEVDGYQYVSIEGGVTPQYAMTNVTSDTELIQLINSILNG